MNKPRVAVIFGGKSVEHEISIISALQGYNAIDTNKYDLIPLYITKNGDFYTGEKLRYMESFKNIEKALAESTRVVPVKDVNSCVLMKYPPNKIKSSVVDRFDIAVPIVHGTNVEDGTLQGLLEYLGVPYACPDVTSSATGMDKWLCKSLLMAEGLPVVKGIQMHRSEFFKDTNAALDKLIAELNFPVIVKPVNLGSSIGIKKANNREELLDACEHAFTFASRVLCEIAVPNLREINCSVLGDCDHAIPSVCEEPLNATDILTFNDKYTSGGGKSKGMSSTKRQLPALITESQTARIQDLAVRAFKAIGLSGVCRIDFLLNDETGEIFINEPNTIPGSLSFYLWEASGIDFTQLMDKLIELALKKHREKAATVYSFNSNVLAAQGGSKGAKGKA